MSVEKIHALKELFSNMDYVDLSPLLENDMPRWPTHPPLVINQTVTHSHDGYYCQTVFMPEHIGSHVDSPAHIHAKLIDRTIETFPPQCLLAPAVTYPLYKLGMYAGRQASAEEILKLETEMGDEAESGDIVLLNYGWQDHAKNDGMWKDFAYNAPGLNESAVKLFYERKIRAAGSDTMTCDQAVKDAVSMKSYGHDVYWLPNDILIMEGLVNLNQLPIRSFFAALPLKIKNGSGSPIRCVAIIPKD
jgi:arylformamidase